MTAREGHRPILGHLDGETRCLVRLAALVAGGTEADIRTALGEAVSGVRSVWVEELLLQTYLFAGFPRALNAMREWRRVRPHSVPDDDVRSAGEWRADGERTCAAVYGSMYDRLRENVRELHERLDDWMITEGYGKVLSRSGLDLPRRELCIVAACAATAQDRQLHSHLHGALNVGVASAVVDASIEAIGDIVGGDRHRAAMLLWARVKGK